MSTPNQSALPRPRLVVLAAGNGSNLQALWNAVDAGQLDAEIVLVVSHRTDAFALERAKNRGVATAVRTLAEEKAAGGSRASYDVWLTDTVRAANPDLVVCAGWMLIVGEPFLTVFAGRAINLHPALPGAFIGKDAIGQAFAAFQRGEVAETGVMVHEVVADLDAGAPIAVEHVPIARDDTVETLTSRMHAAEHRVLVRAVRIKLGQSTS